MCLVKVGKFVHELAAIYMTAAIESVLEELVRYSILKSNLKVLWFFEQHLVHFTDI